MSAGRSARKGVGAEAASGTAAVLALASAFGLACGTGAGAVRRGGGARDTDGVDTGALAAGCSTDGCCDGSAAGVAGCAVVTCGETTSTCRSGTSIRRSCQGKPRPGSHPWPPKIKLNSNVCISSESSSAYVSRLRSGLALVVGASLKPVELKRVLPLRIPFRQSDCAAWLRPATDAEGLLRGYSAHCPQAADVASFVASACNAVSRT